MSDPTTRLTGAQAVVRFLQAQWTERDGRRQRAIPAIFGIFGHGNVYGLGQALTEPGIAMPFHAPKHEQAMVHTALGCAKATRRLSTYACTASIGPGAANLVTGAATATANRLPVLLLPADTFASRRSGVVLQQLEHPSYADWSVNDCLRPVSRYFDRISRPEQLLSALPEAIRTLFDPAETGAVTLALHQDVQGEAHHFPSAFFAERTWVVRRPPPEPVALRAAAEVLRSARQPLVIAGGGVVHSGAEDALGRLSAAHALPVAETSAGKGACGDGRPVGGIGVNGSRAANALAAVADVVLCVGTRLSDFTTASLSLFQAPDVRFLSVNVTPSDAHRLGALPVVADARTALEALDAALGGWRAPVAWTRRVDEAVEAWKAELDADLEPSGSTALTQGQALRAINQDARSGDWVVAAAGGPPGDLLKLWEPKAGARSHLEFAFSCMGHEISAGLGIRMADPEAGNVVVIVGDGTYLMAPTELVTAVQEGLDVTVVVLVNGGYQSIHGLQRRGGAPSLGTEFRRSDDQSLVTVDYVANAVSMGCSAVEVRDAEALRSALHAARGTAGPSVIVCHVDPHRALLDSGAFWDLGIAQSSQDPDVVAAADAHREAALAQRVYGWVP